MITKLVCWLFRHPSKTDVTFAGKDRLGHVYCRCGVVDSWWREFDAVLTIKPAAPPVVEP